MMVGWAQPRGWGPLSLISDTNPELEARNIGQYESDRLTDESEQLSWHWLVGGVSRSRLIAKSGSFALRSMQDVR